MSDSRTNPSSAGDNREPNRRATAPTGQPQPPESDLPEGLEREDRQLRGSVVDRRIMPDRRHLVVDGKPVDLGGSGLERRRGPGRRLSDFQRSAEEGHLTREQFLFLMAIDEFKKANDKSYPTWTDVLEVVRLLGYRKTMKSELHLTRAEDWLEQATSPSNVRPQRWHERFQGKDQKPGQAA